MATPLIFAVTSWSADKLTVACEDDDVDTVQRLCLLDHDNSMWRNTALTSMQRSPLHLAAASGSLRVVQYLHGRRNHSFATTDFLGAQPLDEVLFYVHEPVFAYMCDSRAITADMLLHRSAESRQSPLSYLLMALGNTQLTQERRDTYLRLVRALLRYAAALDRGLPRRMLDQFADYENDARCVDKLYRCAEELSLDVRKYMKARVE